MASLDPRFLIVARTDAPSPLRRASLRRSLRDKSRTIPQLLVLTLEELRLGLESKDPLP
jgi:hypothetical protein